MKWATFIAGSALSLACASPTLASSSFVSAFDGPWSVGSNPGLSYGVGDNTGPVVLTLATGVTSITITYLDGLASAFGGAPPSVDALGYVGGIFGSGMDPSVPFVGTGIGSSGMPFPSYFIDPTNSGPPIYLMSLIGAFTDGSGVVIGTPFAPGDGPFTIAVPSGATYLSLGANDDIYSDNSGGWYIGVTGVTGGVPEPSTWVMMLLGFAGLGFAGYRTSRKPVSIAA